MKGKSYFSETYDNEILTGLKINEFKCKAIEIYTLEWIYVLKYYIKIQLINYIYK